MQSLSRRLPLPVLVLALLLAAAAAASPPPAYPVREDIRTLQAAIAEMEERHRQEVLELHERLRLLESRLVAAPATPEAPTPAPPPEVRYRLLDLSFSGLFAAGASTARDETVAALQAGAHDPSGRGFTVQNLEVSMAGAVDPYLRGEAHLVFQIDQEGESGLEVEEAFLTTQSLPAGLQVKAGTYFTEFGRLNPQHPHAWQFVDQPVVSSRLLGADGLRGPGARLSWLMPTPWYSEWTWGVQRAHGETAVSFLSTDEEEPIAGHPHVDKDVRSPDDLLYTARWLSSVACSDATTLSVGASLAAGPNATGEDTDTRLYGLDLYLKWTKPTNEKGWPFVTWQMEVMRRDYEAAAFVDDETGAEIPSERLWDRGAYTQVVWGFRPRFTWGVRLDWAEGEDSAAAEARLDPLRDARRRVSTALTWLPSEFSKLRLQYNWDRSEFLGLGEPEDEHSLWIQWEFALGAHAAHQF
jgi:hypothetical protein